MYPTRIPDFIPRPTVGGVYGSHTDEVGVLEDELTTEYADGVLQLQNDLHLDVASAVLERELSGDLVAVVAPTSRDAPNM
jgi:hypothetical protein